MCEQLSGLVEQEEWNRIASHLKIPRGTLKLLEKEMPGEANFRNRVSRALEYWMGSDDPLKEILVWTGPKLKELPLVKLNAPSSSSRSDNKSVSINYDI